MRVCVRVCARVCDRGRDTLSVFTMQVMPSPGLINALKQTTIE